MKIVKYPDGSSYAEVTDDLNKLNEKEGYAFTYRINTYEDLWHLGQILEIMDWKGASPIVTIPNLIDAQADRRFNTNKSFGLKMVCKFLNTYQNAYFRIFHPHNPEVVEALMDNVEIIDNSEFITSVLKSIGVAIASDGIGTIRNPNLILMSSDAGGFKPLMKLCDNINWQGETYSASKARLTGHSETRMKQLIDRQDFEGKDILIVDDICVYGGTFKGLSKMLKERNCGRLFLACSHGTIQNLGDDPVTNYYDKVFFTNSKFSSYLFKAGKRTFTQPINLKIIKLF